MPSQGDIAELRMLYTGSSNVAFHMAWLLCLWEAKRPRQRITTFKLPARQAWQRNTGVMQHYDESVGELPV